MIFSMIRVPMTTLVLAGLVAGGSAAAAGLSAGRDQPGRHSCVSAGGGAALSAPCQVTRLLDPDGDHLLAIAIRRSVRPRIVVYPRPPYPEEEHGAIYGYAPGYYQLGRAGVLYGPYPLNPNAPPVELRY